MKVISKELSAAEASFLKWQYGFNEVDEPFERVLWQAIMRAWEADNARGSKTRHLARLGAAGAYARACRIGGPRKSIRRLIGGGRRVVEAVGVSRLRRYASSVLLKSSDASMSDLAPVASCAD
jgi:hypothetical protein